MKFYFVKISYYTYFSTLKMSTAAHKYDVNLDSTITTNPPFKVLLYEAVLFNIILVAVRPKAFRI